ncbi:MAG TPA: amylo-alpha-1,6-glucosidase [Stellaceae bacterium]|nr:amylo-alpha-1,6-glucosidase [Stellaceae bacterium]
MIEPIRIGKGGDEPLVPREWLVTNGLGGFASATIAGEITRRYHGMLIAALAPPHGRMVVLNDLQASVELADGSFASMRERGEFLGFTLSAGLPSWRYAIDDVVIEKSIVLISGHNMVHINFRLMSGERPVRLRLRPFVNFRALEAPVSDRVALGYAITARGPLYEIAAGPDLPILRITTVGGSRVRFIADGGSRHDSVFPMEAQRGYESHGEEWSPGYFDAGVSKGEGICLIAATEPWHTVLALDPNEARRFEHERRRRLVAMARPAARGNPAAELVLAADQFVITPIGRIADLARAHAEGDDVRTVIAGYHWFTDWGRDTMISLEGLTLATGRANEAGWILRTFTHYVRDGLIPNMFPEGENRGLYHTADATLWFFHALHRYVAHTGDHDTLKVILPTLKEIIRKHFAGTRFGIRVDPGDGLLTQGAEGYQLTWMDAKVGDWVVTPRRGKAVEINALWYNALRLTAEWLDLFGDDEADAIASHAATAQASFNRRFWNAEGGCLYDVVDGENGDDASFRPNQIFAISLDHAVLDVDRWEAVVTGVERRLLTPMGLRSLAPGEPDYKPHYLGELRARDAAYHQGTVWAWLIGPFIDAWLKVHPGQEAAARRFLAAFEPHLSEAGIGSISEVFDGEPPFAPRGCIAQAWSVAEVLRSWVRTAAKH